VFPQSDNVLNEQSRNVLKIGYNQSLKTKEDYGWRGHYRDEFEGFEKAEGCASGIREADHSDDGVVNVGS
jgi:hypothetical protein